MATAIRGNYAKHLDRDVSKIFMDEYTSYETQYDKIARTQTAPAGGHYTEAELSSLGALREKPEGTAITFDTPIEGNEVTRNYTTYSLGFQITNEMLKDDLQKNFMKMPKELGKSAAYKRETEFFDLFNNGFATHTAWDGGYLFATSGRTTLKSGTAQNNAASTGGALSETTLQAALEYGMTAKDSSGRPIALKPRLLLVPTGVYWTAKNLSLAEFSTLDANNDINTVRDEGWKYMVSPHLTDVNAWFLIFSDHDLRFLWKEAVNIESADDFQTGNRMYKATMRFSTFMNNPVGVYGNSGGA